MEKALASENILMATECTQFVFGFHSHEPREIRAQFDGGAITSDGGGLLLARGRETGEDSLPVFRLLHSIGIRI